MLTFLATTVILSDAPNFPTKFVDTVFMFDITQAFARVAFDTDGSIRRDAAGEPLWVLVKPIPLAPNYGIRVAVCNNTVKRAKKGGAA